MINNCIDWIAISAIATSLMAIATFFTLRQNKKQLKELKRQWQEEHRAHLEFSIDIFQETFFLKIQNTGKSVAYIKKIEINKEFLDMLSPNIKNGLEFLHNHSSTIVPSSTKHYVLSSVHSPDLEKMKSTPVIITTTFIDGFIRKEEFSINDYNYIGYAIRIESNTEMVFKKIEGHLKVIKENIKQKND